MKKLLIADGTNIMFRSFYGVRPFTTRAGLHTNAVYGVATTLSHQMETVKPDAVAVAFDLSAPTFRHKMYDEYKGTRKKAPDELIEQIPYVRRCVNALGAHSVDLEGYEADDILGTLALRGEAEGYEVYILTGDRDALQLITDKTRVIYITNKENILYDKALFFENYGAEPERLVDIKALMGDSSDNIPGVPGIGEKTAKKLISESGSLSGIYNNIDSIAVTNSVREKLKAGRDLAFMSFDLATICRDAPLERSLESFAYSGIEREALSALFAELEFYKLSERFGLNETKQETQSSVDADRVPDAEPLTVDIAAELTAPAVYLDKDGVLYVYSDGKAYKAFKESREVLHLFGACSVITHDSKALYAEMKSLGVTVKCSFDTMLAAYVLRSGESSYALPRLFMTYLSVTEESLRGEDTAALISRLANAEREELAKVDAEAEARGQAKASELLYGVEMPLAPVLADMEAVGFKIDGDGVRGYARMLSRAEAALAEQIYFRAGRQFNINSPKQLGTVLFEEMGIPAGKKTKTGYSTDADTLEGLRYSYEIVDDILNYRQIAKLRGTYGDALADMADENGRIHSSFNQTVTSTGRLSSTEPNLQNIPVRTEMGRELRRFFVPKSEDYILIDADYSQIELRILAAISNDEIMKNAFLSGVDIHTSTASQVFGVPEATVTKELRSRAKAVNFGIVYGIGDYSLSRDIGTSRKTAAEYIANYLATYKGVDAYLKNTVADAREHGYVTTVFGRRRYIPEINVSNKMTRAFGERVAMNSPIQGAAADVIKLAMINTARALREAGLDAVLILQIHDELIVEAHKDDADRAAEILRREMEGAVALSVPLSVEVATGRSWYECK